LAKYIIQTLILNENLNFFIFKNIPRTQITVFWKQYINKLHLHTVLNVFSQDEAFRPTLSLIPGSAPESYNWLFGETHPFPPYLYLNPR
jgi:hypothetical protein